MPEFILKKHQALTPDIIDLELMPLHSSQPIIFQAGQYLKTYWNKQQICLSIANTPQPNQQINLTVRHTIMQPAVQNWLKNLLATKTTVLDGPFGSMTTSSIKKDHTLLFLAGGTGFAPIGALLTELYLNQHQNIKAKLYWGLRRPIDNYAQQLLTKIKSHYSNFNYKIILSNNAFPNSKLSTGYAHKILVSDNLDLSCCQIMASGPFAMLAAAKKLYLEHNLDPSNFINDFGI